MTKVKPTPARLALMRAVADPNTSVYASISRAGGSWSTADVYLRPPYKVERKVTGQIRPLEDAGLVTRAPGGARFFMPRPYSLTDAGRQWLADHNKEQPDA